MYANAIDGVLAMLYTDPSSILRRIGIIAIEDVCLVKRILIYYWLMMAIKYISLTKFITTEDPQTVEEQLFGRFNIETIALKIPIIKEAIDFHPFPQLIAVLTDEQIY